jgi:hypothetical protein
MGGLRKAQGFDAALQTFNFGADLMADVGSNTVVLV